MIAQHTSIEIIIDELNFENAIMTRKIIVVMIRDIPSEPNADINKAYKSKGINVSILISSPPEFNDRHKIEYYNWTNNK